MAGLLVGGLFGLAALGGTYSNPLDFSKCTQTNAELDEAISNLERAVESSCQNPVQELEIDKLDLEDAGDTVPSIHSKMEERFCNVENSIQTQTATIAQQNEQLAVFSKVLQAEKCKTEKKMTAMEVLIVEQQQAIRDLRLELQNHAKKAENEQRVCGETVTDIKGKLESLEKLNLEKDLEMQTLRDVVLEQRVKIEELTKTQENMLDKIDSLSQDNNKMETLIKLEDLNGRVDQNLNNITEFKRTGKMQLDALSLVVFEQSNKVGKIETLTKSQADKVDEIETLTKECNAKYTTKSLFQSTISIQGDKLQDLSDCVDKHSNTITELAKTKETVVDHEKRLILLEKVDQIQQKSVCQEKSELQEKTQLDNQQRKIKSGIFRGIKTALSKKRSKEKAGTETKREESGSPGKKCTQKTNRHSSDD